MHSKEVVTKGGVGNRKLLKKNSTSATDESSTTQKCPEQERTMLRTT